MANTRATITVEMRTGLSEPAVKQMLEEQLNGPNIEKLAIEVEQQ